MTYFAYIGIAVTVIAVLALLNAVQLPWQVHKDERKGTGLPPIYTTWSGRQFVDADELVQSEKGMREIKRMSKMDDSRKKS